jgi:universal stress protein A
MAVGKYEHILLAVDFAPETARVVERGAELRDRYGARLRLVHVVEYMPMSYSGDVVLPDDFDLERELLDIARKQIDELGDRLGVPAEDRHLEVGSTGKSILRVAQAQSVDLIVIGSHGRHGIAALLGSTARTVVHGADRDVLAVRIQEGQSAQGA